MNVDENSDLYKSQVLTFQSILKAKNFVHSLIDVVVCTTQYSEDVVDVPTEFKVLSNLTQSVLDVNPALKGKKLPLINDVLYKLNEVDADFCIYTNVDITLMPFFYDAIYEYINLGHDAVIINRRRISAVKLNTKNLALMYADIGLSHPGFDCFVFKKELLQKFELSNICVGIPFIEVALAHNIFAFAQNPLFVPDAHLTFHIGTDVMPTRNKQYYWHNRNTFFSSIKPKLKTHYKLKKFPYHNSALFFRFIKWGLNPSLFTLNYLQLEQKNIVEKLKHYANEIRWRLLQR